MTDRPDPATLLALAERVEKGEYGRQINAEVLVAVGEYRWENEYEKNSHGQKFLIRVADGKALLHHTAPDLTGSLDAIEAARVRLLPGFSPSVVALHSGAFYCRQIYRLRDDGAMDGVDTRATTERHARLSALLRAYRAKLMAEGRG
jgi:hypothetical protein